MNEIELIAKALMTAAEDNSGTMVITIIIGILIYVTKQGLEWIKAKWSHEDTAAVNKREQKKIEHDDNWKMFEETRVDSKRLRTENKRLYMMMRESLTFHIDAQAMYLRTIDKLKACIPIKDMKCPFPSCKVRSAFENELDDASSQARSEINEMFRDWMKRANEKDTDSGEIQ